MTWADSVPNLLIGLREGLEAGLVVTILLAAVKKTATAQADRDGAARVSTAPIWLGVLGAVTLSGAFAAVLTFSVSVLSSAGQEAVGGLLSVFAVGLVTAMIFWMRRTAATLSSHLRGEVARAAAIGTGALTITAFLSVGREGLETTLFLWTAARASGQTAAPLVGAAIGIAAAVVLCWLLYRRAVHLNVGVFFNRTAIALIVIAAGVLAYGLGDLQDANFLPGHAWIAFDLTAHIDPTSWWASIITGITELSPKMTVLQVTAYLAYLVVVIPAFVNAGRAVNAAPRPEAAQRPEAAGVAPESPAAPVPNPVPALAGVSPAAATPSPVRGSGRWERLAGGRPWAVAGVLIVVPALAAGVTIAAMPTAASGPADAVTVSKTECAPEFTSAESGNQTFTVANNSGMAGEINLDNAAGAVVGEIETIGPGTSAQLTADLGDGTYVFKCLMGSQVGHGLADGAGHRQDGDDRSRPGRGQAGHGGRADPARTSCTRRTPPPSSRTWPARSPRSRRTCARATSPQAKTDWLAAQLDWERVGASYDSFGDLGLAVDGLPTGFVKGVNDPGFTGLHRLEYGLWHGQPAAELLPVTQRAGEERRHRARRT